MLILNGKQMRATDEYTIRHNPIPSIDLMERAARECFRWITSHHNKTNKFTVVCGPGNNGGDGLAIARMLLTDGFSVSCYLVNSGSDLSPDCKTNLYRLKEIDEKVINEISSDDDLAQLQFSDIVIDALFGTGLTRPVDGIFGKVIDLINNKNVNTISIDLPSGMFTNECSFISNNHIVKCNTTLTFQYLKPALLVGENSDHYGSVTVLDIGLMLPPEIKVNRFYTDRELISKIYKPRPEFSNKGTFGHALLIAGGKGKMGATLLAANGYLKSGGGLLTMMVPETGVAIIQTGVPEAMCITYDETFTGLSDKHQVAGIGPGMGTDALASTVVEKILQLPFQHLVIDADGLNCIAVMKNGLEKIPPGAVLTPHPGEFKRLAGTWANDFEKLEIQLKLAAKTNSIIILKGKNTTVACPDGSLYFNSTGNAGMAKGGSGDILTGLITGLIASKYTPEHAAILGVYLHGMAGDLAAQELTEEAMNATDLISNIPKAWKYIAQPRANQ